MFLTCTSSLASACICFSLSPNIDTLGSFCKTTQMILWLTANTRTKTYKPNQLTGIKSPTWYMHKTTLGIIVDPKANVSRLKSFCS